MVLFSYIKKSFWDYDKDILSNHRRNYKNYIWISFFVDNNLIRNSIEKSGSKKRIDNIQKLQYTIILTYYFSYMYWLQKTNVNY